MQKTSLEQLHAAVSDVDPVIVSGFAIELNRQPDPARALLLFTWALRNPEVLDDLQAGKQEQERHIEASIR